MEDLKCYVYGVRVTVTVYVSGLFLCRYDS